MNELKNIEVDSESLIKTYNEITLTTKELRKMIIDFSIFLDESKKNI